MASLQKTFKGDLTVSIAKRIFAVIKKMSKSAKEDLIDVDDDESNPISALSSIVPTPNKPSGKNKPQSNIEFDKGELGKLARKDPLLRKRLIQERIRPMGRPPIINAERGFFPRAFSGIFNDGIEVRDKKLGVFLEKVALSLSSSLNTVNEKLNETNENVISAKDGINQTYRKLEQSSDSLEQKLDSIIEALRFANRADETKRDRNEASAKEAFIQQQVDLSNANRILMQDMDRQEIRDMQAADIAEDDRGAINNLAGNISDNEEDELPSLARGGIVSGPDSGYLAVLHGDEAVIPLDNNFTQGESTAVGKEPISNMPMMAERGITPGDNPSSMRPKFTMNSSKVSTPRLNSSGSGKGGGDLAKAIQLPSKVAGLVTGSLVANVLSSSILPKGITKHIKTIISPIMNAFGVPNVASNLAEESGDRFTKMQKDEGVLSANLGRRGREKGILGKIKSFLFGEGGGSMTYRGMGGNTYVNNRTSGVGGKMYGTGGFFGGKKKEKTYKSKQDFGAILRATAMKDATMVINGFGDPERFKKKYGITAEQFLALPDYPTDQSSLNSDVFTKSVAYENAYDYRKFESPDYGLKEASIAYNMSMDDEVSNIMNGLSEPENQILMNNQNASGNVDNQLEYSAIKVKGNPLKSGTYISPYSV